MEEKIGKKIDFDIDKTIKNMEAIRGKIDLHPKDTPETTEVYLLKQDEHNYLQVLPLESAMKVIDYVWDNAFRYV